MQKSIQSLQQTSMQTKSQLSAEIAKKEVEIRMIKENDAKTLEMQKNNDEKKYLQLKQDDEKTFDKVKELEENKFEQLKQQDQKLF